MAGTPTPNYQFPTYAETDTPNLAGAYNQAVNAIDAKIKEVADTISSGADVPDATSTTKGIAKLYDSTTVGAVDQDDGGITPKAVDDKISGSLTGYAPKFTVAAPITYSGNQIGVNVSSPAQDGSTRGNGVVTVTGKQADITAADALNTGVVPNVKAVKDYVDAKVPTEQLAYTGTAPIVVDNGDRSISIDGGTDVNYLDGSYTKGSPSIMNYLNSTATTQFMNSNDTINISNVPGGWFTVSPYGLRAFIKNRTPDATTSVKGLVQLTDQPSSANSSLAVTGKGVTTLFTNRGTQSNTPVTVDLLKYLYYDTVTGIVYCKPPTE